MGAAATRARPLTPLAGTLAADAPLSVEAWMARCNAHYYANRDPLGAAGDFTTAPEISQMFGELAGTWLAELWGRADSPECVRLVELGPGRGTLMADALRATRRVPGFHAAARVHFVETSVVLRGVQAGAVPGAAWHDDLADVPDDAPLLLVANEFFDALPVRQFIGGRERLVTHDGERFAADAGGPVREDSPARAAVAALIGARLAARGGAALIVDYGHDGTAHGDTLQAVRRHAAVDPFDAPGEADLTAHVDFGALTAAAGVAAHGPVAQGVWLARLGIEARAAALKRAVPAQAAAIAAAALRLTAPTAMGALFKVLALTGRDWPRPAGFAE